MGRLSALLLLPTALGVLSLRHDGGIAFDVWAICVLLVFFGWFHTINIEILRMNSAKAN
jgi:hypothetical protein